ncbi:pinin/SDK/memA/ protein conserved region-domain-containing protein [Lipomyces chichibuensis]|uniref:pinin/SDK/memA/ protein conserved region-domain-containing protein n=1 Tax=Lipomyces chichibuensis TaxID=1546026 RepID=UPI00334345B9
MSEPDHVDTSTSDTMPTVVVPSTVVKPEATLPSKRERSESRTPSPSRSISGPLVDDGSAVLVQPKRIRRNPSLAAAEEKGRNKRMFGILLTSLGKFQEETSRSRVTSKREEVERRVRESQRKESLDMERQIREERLQRSRLAEYRRTHSALSSKTAMMREHAPLLKTATVPVVYYKPKILRKEEEETIAKQMEEMEYKIKQEWDDFFVRFPKEEFGEPVLHRAELSEPVQTDGRPANANGSERGYKSDEAEDDDSSGVALAA